MTRQGINSTVRPGRLGLRRGSGTGANASHPNEGLSQCHGCGGEDVVTPHASFLALDVAAHTYLSIEAMSIR